VYKYIINLFLIFLVFLVFLFSGCDIINPSEEVPAYIQIDSVILIQPSSAYQTSENITDVWINLDGQKMGVYQLPAKFPVIAEGKHHLTVRAGIKDNGISASRIIYPFYTFFELDTDFVPQQTINITPDFKYQDGLNKWIETFEDPGYKLELTSKSDTTLERIPDPRDSSENVGAFYLSPDRTIFQCATTDVFPLTYNAGGIFVELDYMNDQEFVVGLFINKPDQTIETPVIHINPHPDSFNKIYIDLLYIVSQNPDAIDYKLFVGAEKVDSLDNPKIYFDNLTLIYP